MAGWQGGVRVRARTAGLGPRGSLFPLPRWRAAIAQLARLVWAEPRVRAERLYSCSTGLFLKVLPVVIELLSLLLELLPTLLKLSPLRVQGLLLYLPILLGRVQGSPQLTHFGIQLLCPRQSAG